MLQLFHQSRTSKPIMRAVVGTTGQARASSGPSRMRDCCQPKSLPEKISLEMTIMAMNAGREFFGSCSRSSLPYIFQLNCKEGNSASSYDAMKFK